MFDRLFDHRLECHLFMLKQLDPLVSAPNNSHYYEANFFLFCILYLHTTILALDQYSRNQFLSLEIIHIKPHVDNQLDKWYSL